MRGGGSGRQHGERSYCLTCTSVTCTSPAHENVRKAWALAFPDLQAIRHFCLQSPQGTNHRAAAAPGAVQRVSRGQPRPRWRASTRNEVGDGALPAGAETTGQARVAVRTGPPSVGEAAAHLPRPTLQRLIQLPLPVPAPLSMIRALTSGSGQSPGIHHLPLSCLRRDACNHSTACSGAPRLQERPPQPAHPSGGVHGLHPQGPPSHRPAVRCARPRGVPP